MKFIKLKMKSSSVYNNEEFEDFKSTRSINNKCFFRPSGLFTNRNDDL